jgi:hypothetical protein
MNARDIGGSCWRLPWRSSLGWLAKKPNKPVAERRCGLGAALPIAPPGAVFGAPAPVADDFSEF